jgi:hypothetical protein
MTAQQKQIERLVALSIARDHVNQAIAALRPMSEHHRENGGEKVWDDPAGSKLFYNLCDDQNGIEQELLGMLKPTTE